MLEIIREIYRKCDYGYIGSLSIVIYSLPAVICAVLIYWIIRRIIQKRKYGSDFKAMRKKCFINELIRLLLVCWIAEVIAVIALPYDFWSNIWSIAAGYGVPSRSPIPFSYEFSYVPVLYGIIAGYNVGMGYIFLCALNIAAFIPLGLALPFVHKKFTFVKVFLIGFTISLIIELTQPFMYGRYGNIDDLICNTIGCVFGYLLYLLMKKIFPRFVNKGSVSLSINTKKDI